MDDKELLAKVKYLTQNCAFPVKRDILAKMKYLTQNYAFPVKRDILVEELAELLEVTNSPNLYISKWSSDKIIEEFADVYLMLWQMCIYLGDDTVESYIFNYEHSEEGHAFLATYNEETMTFLQKAMNAIWIVSKMRRDPNIPQNFVSFRGVIYLLSEHVQENLDHLKLTKANDVLTKIRNNVIYKVERQMKRIEEEIAPEISCKHDVLMCEEEQYIDTDIARSGYILTKREMEAIKNGSNSAETSD